MEWLPFSRRTRRLSTSELTSPDSIDQYTASTLPELPPRAKARFDHLGFREQDSKVAGDRADALEKKISLLTESEEQLRKEREKLSISAKKELEDAVQRQNITRQRLDRVEKDDIRRLGEQVTMQFDETESALKISLESGGIWKELILPDELALKAVTGQNAIATKKKCKERIQKEEKKKQQKLRRQIADLTKEVKELKEKQDEDSNIDECDDPLSETEEGKELLEEGHSEENDSEEHGNEEHDNEEYDEIEEHPEGHRDQDGHNDTDRQQDKSDEDKPHESKPHEDKPHEDKPHGEEPHNDEGYEEEQKDENRNAEKRHHEDHNACEQCKEENEDEHERRRKMERARQRGRLQKQKKELRQLDVKRLEREIRRKEVQMLGCNDRIADQGKSIGRLTRHLKDLDKEKVVNEDTAMQSDDDQQREQKFRLKLQERDEKEIVELEQQDERENALRLVKEQVIEQRYHSSDSVAQQRRRYARHRAFLRGLKDRSDGFNNCMPDWGDLFEDSYLLYDDADDLLCQPLLEQLETMTSDIEILEAHIRKIQEYRERLNHVMDLKSVLQAEKELEREWIEHLKGHSTLSSGSSSTTPHHGHFSGRPIADANVYKPLNEDEFRVLILLPAPEPYYPLICALETWSSKDLVSTKEAPGREYAALSYFWGSDACNGRIYLVDRREDGPSTSNADEWGSTAKRATRVRIRNNLFRALLRLRRAGPTAHAVALWVDFMCIDQDNTKEKTQQLTRMVKIYSNASNVCIWLGESDSRKRSDDAMEFIRTIMDFAVLDRHAKDKDQAGKWYALGELMRDRWFSRRWVVQEIALSKDATVHCGAATVRWSDFADAASLLISNQEAIKSLFDFSDWREGPNTLGDVKSFGASILLESTNHLFLRKNNGEIKRPTKNIESLVTSLKTFDTSNRRDLIYSLVCIASDTWVHEWAPGPKETSTSDRIQLKPDYSKSEVDVYKDFTRFCISSSHSLDIICRPWAMPLKEPSEKSGHLPSWIPLLSSSEFGEPEDVYSGRKNGENLVGQVGKPIYRASGVKKYVNPDAQSSEEQGSDSSCGTQDKNASVDEDRILSARGFRLARIDAISPRNTGGIILRESLRLGGWPGFKSSPDSVPDPIWRTLVADRDQDGQVPPTWYQRACLRCLEIADIFNNGDLNVGELLQGHSDMLRKYLLRVRNVTWNRRFFTAVVRNPEAKEAEPNKEYPIADQEQSNLFGLSPPNSAQGDFICILDGCSVPVVLRSTSDGFMELIGEAYVHGKMDGEAMEDYTENKTWEEEVFKIC